MTFETEMREKLFLIAKGVRILLQHIIVDHGLVSDSYYRDEAHKTTQEIEKLFEMDDD